MCAPSDIDPDRLRRLAADGLSQAEIARVFGVSSTVIMELRRKHGISIRGTDRPAASIVPHWVPKSLHAEYVERMKLYGEEGAASHVRRLKAEMLR